MKKYIMAIALITGFFSAVFIASEGSDVNYVEIGARVFNDANAQNLVAEHESAQENVDGYLGAGILNSSGDLFYSIDLEYMNDDDFLALIDIHKSTWFHSRTSINRIFHRTDHDNLVNLQSKSGPKMLSNEDTDPDADHETIYTDFEQVFNFIFGTKIKTDIEAGFSSKLREGHRQALSINHCDNCHVVGRTVKLDEQIQDGWVQIGVQTKRIKVSYKLNYSKFSNDADAPLNHYDLAQHPTLGLNPDFESRMNYSDETLPYGMRAENRKLSHELRVDGVVNEQHRLIGNLSHSSTKNRYTNLDMDMTSGSGRWSWRPGGKWSLDTTLSHYVIDNDDIFVDLEWWRDGMAGGGSLYDFNDFDFTRQSTYDRDVSEAKFKFRYKINPQHRMAFSYDFKNVSRDLTCSNSCHGSNYYKDSDDVERHEFGGYDGDTKSHLLKFRWDGKFNQNRIKASTTVSYKMVDDPFTNASGIMEKSLCSEPLLPGQTVIFYFQRERYGDATNLPSEEWKLSGNMSVKAGKNGSFAFNANYTDSSNDEMNTYKWEGNSWAIGAHYFMAFSESSIFSVGYDHGKMESNALLSIPVFDG